MASPFSRSKFRARGKAFWATLLRASGVLYMARKWVQRHGAIVLTFHRVLTDSELQQTASLPGMIVRDSTFSDFLKYASSECDFVDLARDPDWSPSDKLRLAITFDDGWSDNASAAFPTARQCGAPLTIFIVPEKTGTDLPFWPERTVAALDRPSQRSERYAMLIEREIEALKELPTPERERRIGQMAISLAAVKTSASVDRTMSWAEILQLQAGGVTFGSHTNTHEILTTIPLSQAEQEISSSRALIQQRLKTSCSLFSYPNGDYSARVRSLVANAGYKLAFLNQDPGVWTRDSDPFLIPRVNVCEYHLVNSQGNFSSLIFDYAVVWNAAKGLLAQKWMAYWEKPQVRDRSSRENTWHAADKKTL